MGFNEFLMKEKLLTFGSKKRRHEKSPSPAARGSFLVEIEMNLDRHAELVEAALPRLLNR
jgi:hypothetical protein